MGTYDYILLGIVAVFIITGYRKGLVMSVLGLFSWVISFVVAKALTPVCLEYFKTTDYYKSIGNSIFEKFAPLKTYTTNSFMNAIDSGTINDKSGLLKGIFSKGIENGKIFDPSSMVTYLSQSITDIIVTVGCTILIFILCRILVSFALSLIKGVVSSLPVVKQFDKVGGVIFGLAEGVLIAYVVVMLFSVLSIGSSLKGNGVGPVAAFFTSLNLMDLIVNNFIVPKK